MSSKSCPTIELSAFLDGELASARAAGVESHLASCPACQSVARDEKTLKRSLLILACPSADVLAAYADGSLDAKAQAGVERHASRCAACSDVVAWTRQASLMFDSGEIAAEPVVPRRRRGRPAAPRKQAKVIQLVAPIAAAAAVAAAALLFLRTPSAPETDVAFLETPAPAPSKKPVAPSPVVGRSPAPRATESPRPLATETPALEPSPETVPGPSPEASPLAPEATPAPTESERPAPSESPAAPEPGTTTVAIALAGGDLRVGPSREKATRVAGSVQVSSKDAIYAAAGGRFRVGETDVLLAASSEARLTSKDGLARLSLEKGETFAEASAVDLELACHGAVARAASPGAKLLLRAAPRGAVLLCTEGKATFACASSEVSLGAGESSEVENDAAPSRPHAADLHSTAWVDDARAERALAVGLEYPRGFLAAAALEACRKELTASSATLRDRARALYAIEAARAADPRLASLAETLAGAEADARFDAIVAGAATDPTAAPAATLALLARPRRPRLTPAAATAQQKALPKLLAPLAQAIEKASSDDVAKLAADLDTALAARALKLSPARLRSLLERPAGTADETTTALERLARTPLATLEPREIEAGLKAIDQLLAKDAVVPAYQLPVAAVLAADRSCATAGNARDDDRRFAKLLAQLAARGVRPCTASPSTAADTLLVVARDAQALAGRKDAAPPTSSVVVVLRGSSVEVTFSVESAKRPKQIVLAGSWDDWREDKAPMTQRRDGSFVETVVLPRGRYDYKLRLDIGRLWEPDAKNPLAESDGKGGTNSVLQLE